VSHPTPGDLLLLHFGEVEGERARVALSTHLARCPRCGVALAELEALERALAPGATDAPPLDGLDRVLRRVEGMRPARARRDRGRRAAGRGRRAAGVVLPSLVAAMGAGVAVHLGGLGAALALFAAGALVTLALAPVLVLESQRRSS